MKTRFFRHLPLPLLCGAIGWWARGAVPSQLQQSLPNKGSQPVVETSFPDESSGRRSLSTRTTNIKNDLSSSTPTGLPMGVDRMQTTDPSDMLAMLEAIGAMTRMTDAEAKQAWLELSERTPTPGFGNSLSVLYLWSRLRSMGESVEILPGWGAEQYQQAIDTEKARGNLAGLRKRMESGEGLSEAERRVVLTDTVREDPLKAVELWCLSTRPEDYRNDAKWLLGALGNPDSRAAIMERIRKWQGAGDLAGAVSMLANQWISKDPDAVERWLQEPAQADVKGALMAEVANAKALAEPAKAWEWSEHMEGEERQRALRSGAMQLAVRDPDEGIKLIAKLEEPADRETAVKNFANILAAQDFDKWLAWRDSLPQEEQSMANESAFALWVNMNVDQAVGWLGTQPDGAGRDSMVGLLVNYYAGKDPEACSEWIRTISDADRRKDAAGAALSNVGPYDFEKIRIILAAVGD